MPKTIFLPIEKKLGSDRAGISVTYTKNSKILSISGWYDTNVGIEGDYLTLAEFFDKLGITEKDCEKAFFDIAISKN